VPAAVAPRPADSLAAEIRALGEARGAMQGGDPAKALVLLDEQSAAYASGQLREERTAARVLALCKLGKRDEARALAARFLADNPRSPLADRVRGACAAGDPR
jgi:outer membrane protein assembly factor BamD (BamD/ComL family)